mgnify:FL=1
MGRDNVRCLCFGFHRVNSGTFSTRDDDQGTWITVGVDNLLLASELKLMGHHNISNVMAALALDHAAGLPMDVMLRVAREFPGLPHRCEFVRRLKDVDFINDSKGTNVGATVAAIESLAPDKGRVVLIAGGDGKGADFTALEAPIALHCRAVLLIGRDAPAIADVLGSGIPVHRVGSLAEAVSRSAALAMPGDRVLLSPACARFDLFRDYLDHVDQFSHLASAQ